MAYKMTKSRITTLKPHHVKERREAPKVPGERPVNRPRIEWLGDLIKDGTFVRADFAYVVCKETGLRHGCNGQHQSYVLQNCLDSKDMPDFPKDVPLRLEEWECDTTAEMVEILDSYDSPRSNRSSDDRLHNFIGQHPDLEEVPFDCIRAALAGWCFYRDRIEKEGVVQARDRGIYLADEEVREYCKWIGSFSPSSYQGWKRAAVNAAMRFSYLKDLGAATAIWEEAFSETNPDPQSPPRAFVTKMRMYAAGKKQTQKIDYLYSQFKRYFNRQLKELAVTP